jgi:hypothetical protein
MRLLTARLVTAIAVLAMPALAVELKPETSQAFDRYTALAEQQLNAGPFLYADAHPQAKASALRGETVVTEPRIDGVSVPDGLIHDWLGVLFIRGATIDRVRALMQDYDNYKRIYAPDVTESKLLARDGDRFRVYLKLYRKEFLTLVYDSEYNVRYRQPEPERMEIVSRSTRIQQQGDDHGFLWRLNSYWRFEEADGGVYAQCRAISLSRDIPFGFGWLHGFLQKFPRDSMVSTLEATRRGAVTAGRGSATTN